MGTFRNVILCEDIRDEVGRKKSLMGVMAGDILVPNFPTTIKIAVYMEYQTGDNDEQEKLSIEFRLLLQDDVELAKGGMTSNVPVGEAITFVLPQALMTVEKENAFRMVVSINKSPEREILSKKIAKIAAT